jgi:beta-1,4-N-acetylglucosaminyltransferase
MMRLLAGVDWIRYSTRVYIVSSGDQMSEAKALALEKSIGTGSVRRSSPCWAQA